jgi:hypothetical protein
LHQQVRALDADTDNASQEPHHRCASLSGASFFKGCRSIPGTIPATSQLNWPISITAINVASCSSATRDLLKSFSCGMGCSIRQGYRGDGVIPRRVTIESKSLRDSPLRGQPDRESKCGVQHHVFSSLARDG